MQDKVAYALVIGAMVLIGGSFAFAWYLTFPQWQAIFGIGVITGFIGFTLADIKLPS